ncbi:uncharacterized protein (DUF58 family) [Halorubrum alkaliphilum]|uniref:Uncharacterized protein (DUF58 family) n=1 Tax=Halorubrum alkaliphilum TaxID=261290 RepID=A0A8T4GIJ7_9EURY|nr:DUF58 domain-containing protein [Halorubrum alkaliphilum]MBP1922912.1 uncharacterized protein (DUF58 family) [Halorubrum alkaliphilum]
MARSVLTRRGRFVLGVCVVAAFMALVVAGRSLNAVVIPGVIALVAGYLQVSRLDEPAARRTGVADGFVGEAHEIELEFHGGRPGVPVDRSFVADVRDRLDDGIERSDAPTRTTVGEEPVTYRARYRRRGDHGFGPVEVDATDLFGLFTRRLVVRERDPVVVYPPCHPVPAWFRRGLYADEAVGDSRERKEFDRLREYDRGDSLRDVHWPATAKHDELVVKEFAAETDRRRVSIAGETADGGDDLAADVLASATASLSLSLLADGVPVDVTLPSGAVSAEPGPRGRRRVLELAARVGPGRVSESAESDVRIVADESDAQISAEETSVDFSALREDHGNAGSEHDLAGEAAGATGEVAGATREDAGAATDAFAVDGGVTNP